MKSLCNEICLLADSGGFDFILDAHQDFIRVYLDFILLAGFKYLLLCLVGMPLFRTMYSA